MCAAAVAMANTAVVRTSDWLSSVESEDGAAVARRSLRLTRSLAEPMDALKGFREQLQRLDLKTSGTRAERATLVSRIAGLEREIREIHAGLQQIERAAQAHPDHVLGPQPAISNLQQKVRAYKPGGDSISPIIERLRRDYGISDAELGIRRPPPRARYVFA